ncbi:Mechanosensitive ion channel-domain-containing protein [Leptodontidium sp. 2 PMI_412]|nr:Mechanosensitive ion channel-domain-containing protein [Leptodontidium sp. 2 PMI_412]
MSSTDTIVHILPPINSTQEAEPYKSKGIRVNTEEIKDRPVLRRDNAGLRNFLADSQGSQNVGYDGEVDTLRHLGRFYNWILTFSVVTRYAFYILPVATLLAIPLSIFATIHYESNIKGIRIMGLFVWLEIVWCSLWIAKLCSKTLPRAFRLCCGVISAGTRKHSLMIKALEVPLSIVFWVIACWASIPVIAAFNPETDVTVTGSSVHWIRSLQKGFLASIPVACVFLVEKMAIEFITVNYHRTQFSARIQESKRRMHLFELLYEASTILFAPYCPKFADDDYIINTSILSTVGKEIQNATDLQTGTPIRIFDNLGRLGTGVTSVFGNIVSEVTGTQRADSKSPHAVVSWALERRPASEALARRVFKSLIKEGNDALYRHDIERVLGPDNRHDAEEIFHALDKDANGDVSLEEMTMMVIELGEGRRAMTKSLHDVDRAIKALDRILMCVVLVGAGMIYGTFFSDNFFKNMSLYTTSLMSFSFAFAGTVQEFTGSCIFLFVKHPYDVGDRVEINNVDLIVEHISLLYTVFRRVDSQRKVQIPNIVNNGNWIENISRSQAMSEHFSLSISAATTFDEIEGLTDELKEFILADENRRDYKDLDVEVLNVGDMTKLELRINLGYKSNWSNEKLRVTRRSKFMCALLSTLRKVQINAPGGGDVVIGDANRPAYSVAVSDEEAKMSQKKYLEEKENAKYVKDKGV